MATLAHSRYKIPLLSITALILVWGVLGAVDVRNFTYTGYVTDGNNTITQVTDGSPAAAAGLKVGDYIQSIGGISVADVRAGARRGRPAVNEVRSFVVERNGQTVSLDLAYAALGASNAAVNYGAIGVGVLFLVFGVWALIAAPSRATALLALLGLAFSPAFTAGPYLTSVTLRTIVTSVVLLLLVLGFAVLTHFLLVFPKAKRALEKRTTTWLIYAPAAIVGLSTLWLLVSQSAATSAVNIFTRVLFGLFLVGYFGTSLAALMHSFVKATAHERTVSGLNLLLAGAVVGLGPSLVISLVGLLAPQVVVPGAQFLPLGVALVPVTFAVAAVRVERTANAVG